MAKHARKGNKLYVQGKLTFNPWLDREGRPQVGADLLLQDFQFVGGSENGASNQSATKMPEHSVENQIAGDIQEITDQTRAY